MVVAVLGDDTVLTLARVVTMAAAITGRGKHVTEARARRNPARVALGPAPERTYYAAFGALQTTRSLADRSRPEIAAHVIGRHVTVVTLGDARDVARLHAEHFVAFPVAWLRPALRPVAHLPAELEAVEVTHLEALLGVDGTSVRDAVDVQRLPACLVCAPDVAHLCPAGATSGLAAATPFT